MQDEVFKGGRNKKAPYRTTHLRMPLELAPLIQPMINLYKRLCRPESESLRLKYLESLKSFTPDSLDAMGVGKVPKGFIPKEDYDVLLNNFGEECETSKYLDSVVQQLTENINAANKILNHACTLRSNSGGAIKNAIREAQEYLE